MPEGDNSPLRSRVVHCRSGRPGYEAQLAVGWFEGEAVAKGPCEVWNRLAQTPVCGAAFEDPDGAPLRLVESIDTGISARWQRKQAYFWQGATGEKKGRELAHSREEDALLAMHALPEGSE